MEFDNKKLRKILSTSVREFNAQALAEADRKLTPKQREEWNAIYASYDSRSILQGVVCGLEGVPIPTDKRDESGLVVMENLPCLVVMQYLVKVLIPAPFFQMDDGVSFNLNSAIGAKVDYIIIGVDRAGECAVASRTMAMEQQRWYAREVQCVQAGDVIPTSVLAVGPAKLTLTACGYDTTLAQAGLSYNYLDDLREVYHTGQELNAKVVDITDSMLTLSVRDVGPDPYQNAALRHPVGSSRIATIVSKSHGGIFCRLMDGCTVVCKYAQQFTDSEFKPGDRVVVLIRSYDDNHHWIRGKIRAKLG